jgi:methylated-DNA-protein-cysteine methyltransferase related protein
MSKSDKKYTFFEDVYQVVRLIPSGRVTSYGAIAQFLGSGGSARMVGWAMNQAHTMPDIPAHRVVNRNGLLTGRHHFNPPERMQSLLESEGISVQNHQIQDFAQLFWNPQTELL